ncbi:benzil reductase ((S)-benzoin forming) [Paenibacillus phyllosphaerae]|uniref:Benzil reductase ((S)-benzoin forming) n=1 Tax=Paenibacillus phyllosphaerae TaxID=274593 RepID=A0A7W5AVF8_9BACL|nr:SDR family NAD(P)-dependent oxidoreductase [Paenibacillus phyllosphaerae]MBB3109503.1 benzil reductase ((S)-benzoin forming) [Paenibacillus phyllosphaerae]
MKRDIVIITGASRGLGEALTLAYLKRGSYVYGLSRGVSEEAKAAERFTAVNVDLSSAAEVEMAMHRLFEQLDPASVEAITLINNAAMLEPIAPIDQCGTDDIADHIHTGLLAPVLLTSLFIGKTREWALAKKLAIVTSGMANYPTASMSLYCSVKAAVNIFTQSVRAEQRLAAHPVRVVAVDPGMIDTQMQVSARSHQGEEAFPLGAFFQESYEQEKLVPADQVAARVIELLDQEQDNEAIVRTYT